MADISVLVYIRQNLSNAGGFLALSAVVRARFRDFRVFVLVEEPDMLLLSSSFRLLDFVAFELRLLFRCDLLLLEFLASLSRDLRPPFLERRRVEPTD